MGKILLLLVGIIIGVMIARFMRQGGNAPRDLTAPPPPRIDARPALRIDAGDMDDPEVIELVRQNRKIEAIKRVRDLTGLGLAEAKDIVDAMENKLR